MLAARVLETEFTEREYLALESVAEVKHEFADGRILARAGADFDHHQIASNLLGQLTHQLDDRPCSVLGSDQRVRVDASREYFYPDVSLVCAEPVLAGPHPPSLTNPNVLVEVLSPSTESYDRGEKWLRYQLLPTLTDYVLVSSTRVFVEHYQRTTTGWSLRAYAKGESLVLGTEELTLDVGALYRRVSWAELNS